MQVLRLRARRARAWSACGGAGEGGARSRRGSGPAIRWRGSAPPPPAPPPPHAAPGRPVCPASISPRQVMGMLEGIYQRGECVVMMRCGDCTWMDDYTEGWRAGYRSRQPILKCSDALRYGPQIVYHTVRFVAVDE